jgi:subtilisin-like proprotein convertase family protein
MKKNILVLFFAVCSLYTQAQNKSPWTRVDATAVAAYNKNTNRPHADKELFFRLDAAMFKQSLIGPGSEASKKGSVEISIPNSEGTLERFLVWESSNFDSELQARFPDIRAYAGVGITDAKASLYFSLSPKGIQTMVLRAGNASEFIEASVEDVALYTLFTSKSRAKGTLPFACKTNEVTLNKELLKLTAKESANNKVFKTLRLALSCTGEYAAKFGGTKVGALAAMNATMTRVNGIFNKDLAVKLNLINNTDIIYTNAATDPYSSSDIGVGTEEVDGTWGQELQNTLTGVVGDANYDIGHLFGASGGGGNAGCIGCVCSSGKGSAYTSPADGSPQGDTFDIDFVAHEMGHQLGANHTFSYELEGAGMNIEPGSGSTIMGYAGITIDYNIQSNSDDYFSYGSIKQIQNNLATKSCPVSTPISNNPPTISAGNDFTIPKGTAFILKGTGSDSDGDSVTYCWEQMDSATSASGDNSIAVPTKTNGPLFRSLYPSGSSTRYMPAYESVLADKLSSRWESVSDVARTLHFALTGRDNAALGTGQTNTDEMIVNVSGTAGPFAVASQNVENLSWFQNADQTITWSVNGVNGLPGSENVNIKLSTDGGLTFSTVLAANTPNDGFQTIKVPNVVATRCRILIEPTNNIYYAVNSTPFAIGYTIASSCDSYSFVAPFPIPEQANFLTKTITVPATTATISDVNFNVDFTHAYLSDVQMEIVSPQGTVVRLFDEGCGERNGTLVLSYDDLGGDLACGVSTLQTVVPFQSLAAFNGENPQGIWTFRVRDRYLTDIGTINSASLFICSQKYTLADPESDVNDLAMFPNPNKGNFTVKFTSKTTNPIIVTINDILGKKLYEKEFENNGNFDENIQLDSSIQSGIYLLTVKDGGDKVVKKIVID